MDLQGGFGDIHSDVEAGSILVQGFLFHFLTQAENVFRLILMHASSRPEPPLKQRFEFGSQSARGSSWAPDWLRAVRGSNELARTAGVPSTGAPALFLAGARKAERKDRATIFVGSRHWLNEKR